MDKKQCAMTRYLAEKNTLGPEISRATILQLLDYIETLEKDAGRYVCECESHKCPAESLRQQLADQKEYYEQVIQDGGNRIKALHQQLAEAQALSAQRWQKLAAIQAREQELRDALENIKAHDEYVMWNRCPDCDYGCKGVCKDTPHSDVGKIAIKSIALPADTFALEALIAKAGEVMRKRCMTQAGAGGIYAFSIRALPGVTLEDLK